MSRGPLGVGLRAFYYRDFLRVDPQYAWDESPIEWFEIVSENLMGIEGQSTGRPLEIAKRIREQRPIALHGVSMNLGSTDPLDWVYLAKLKHLCQELDPAMVSDHACWTSCSGFFTHDLMAVPRTLSVADYISARVARVQDYLGRQIALENISRYVSFENEELSEGKFLQHIADRTGCKVLLDLNNLHVNYMNLGESPHETLLELNEDVVSQVHLAGYRDHGEFLVDSHDDAVRPEVWSLFAFALTRFGSVPVLLEWDDHFPPLTVLEEHLHAARSYQYAAATARTERSDRRDDALFERPNESL